MIKLRPYQKEAEIAIISDWINGNKKLMCVMPTGSGKTVVMSTLHHRVNGKTLILTNREELINQVHRTVSDMYPDQMIGIEQATRHCTPMDNVVVASVPTLGRAGTERILKFNPKHFSLIIIDECHHASPNNSTYINIIDYFESELMVGFTATPFRSDDENLSQIFEKTSYQVEIKDLVPEYLEDIRPYHIRTGIDLDRVRVERGDFKTGDLREMLDIKKRNDLVIEAYQSLCVNHGIKKVIVFAVDIAHANHLEESFREAGYNFYNISGLPMSERRIILNDFRTGRIDGVINCNILTEGFDESSVEAIMMTRPTLSPVLYMQMIGRGTRKHPGKDGLVLIDFVDNYKKNAPVSVGKLFGFSSHFDFVGMKIKTEVIPVVKELSLKWKRAFWECNSMEHIGQIIARLKTEPESQGSIQQLGIKCDFQWVPVRDKWVLELIDKEYFCVYPDGKGSWIGKVKEPVEFLSKKMHWRNVVKGKSVADVIRLSERWIRVHRNGAVGVVRKNANWRMSDPSEGQLKYLRSFGVYADSVENRGHASDLIVQNTFQGG